MTGVAPTVGAPTKAKNAWEALQMVKAMKAQKAAKTVSKTKELEGIRQAAVKKAQATKLTKGIKDGGKGTVKQIEVPEIENYQQIFDNYNMTKASRTNLNNVLNNLPENEKIAVLKVMSSNPSKYYEALGNITPARAGSSIRTIRRQLGFNGSIRTQHADQTHYSMGAGLQQIEDATRKTAGFKRTTDKY